MIIFYILVVFISREVDCFRSFMFPSRVSFADLLATTTETSIETRTHPKHRIRIVGVKKRLDRPFLVHQLKEKLDALVADPEMALIKTLVQAADSRKALSIRVFHVDGLTNIMSYMVIIETNNKPQSEAVVAAIEVNKNESFL